MRELIVVVAALSVVACKPKANPCASILTDAEVTTLAGQTLKSKGWSATGQCSANYVTSSGNSVIHISVVEDAHAHYQGLQNVNTLYEFHAHHVDRQKDQYAEVKSVDGLGDKAVLAVAHNRLLSKQETHARAREVEKELNKELKGKKNPMEIIEGMAKVVGDFEPFQHTLAAQYNGASIVVTTSSSVAADDLVELVPKLDQYMSAQYGKQTP